MAFSERHPHTLVLVTQNYSSARGEESGFQKPELPKSIVQIEDGDSLVIGDDGSISMQINP